MPQCSRFQPNIANDPHHIKTIGRFALIGVSHIPQACGNIWVGSTFSAQHTGETELRAEVFLMGFINHFQRCFFLHHLLWFFPSTSSSLSPPPPSFPSASPFFFLPCLSNSSFLSSNSLTIFSAALSVTLLFLSSSISLYYPFSA